MQDAQIRSDSEEFGSTQIRRLEASIEGLEASNEELIEWWETALEIVTEVRSSELRRRFTGMVKSGHKAKIQVCALNSDDIDWTHSYTPTCFL